MARTLLVFNQVSADGYFCDATGDMSWAHRDDPEWKAFVAGNARDGGGLLLFGRVTYQMMASFWPTPQARAMDPAVADGMNAAEKVVFSRTLDAVSWKNTRLVRGDLEAEVTRLKQQDGKLIVVMGSGSIVSQLARAGLVDEFQIIVNPIVLGAGRTMFEGLGTRLPLRLAGTRVFGNGNVLLTYTPGR